MPQRTRFASNRELRMAVKAPRPKPFGVRMPLAYESEVILSEAFHTLQADGEIPEKVTPRTNLHVTLYPLRKLDAQLRRGLVIGYEFGKASAKIENNLKENCPKQLIVGIGQAAIIRDRYLAFRVESPELEGHYSSVRKALGALGVKGTMRDIEPLHISVGDIEMRLSKYEKHRSTEVLNEFVANNPEMLDHITLDPVEFYPNAFQP